MKKFLFVSTTKGQQDACVIHTRRIDDGVWQHLEGERQKMGDLLAMTTDHRYCVLPATHIPVSIGKG